MGETPKLWTNWEIENMNDQELLAAGQTFAVGEDLYGVSIDQLTARTEILKAELERIASSIDKKQAELSDANSFFKTP